MQRWPRIASLALAAALLAALGGPAAAGTWSWQRKLEFARALDTRQYYDIADEVLGRLLADRGIVGIERAHLHKELGEFHTDRAERVAAEQRDLKAFIVNLSKAREHFLQYLDHPAIKNNPRYALEALEIRMRLSRNTLAIADGHARLCDDPASPEAERAKHKAEALRLYRSAIADFDKAVADKAKDVARVKGLAPPTNADEKLRRKWREQYDTVREEFFRIRLERDITRVRFAQLLKQFKAPEQEWRAQLEAADRDYRQLLLDYVGTPGAIQANFELARCLLEKGIKQDKEALERLGEVWEKRDTFRRFKRIPCEAARLQASVLLRQKKPQEALSVVDGLLAFASDGAWNPEEKSVGGVVAVLGAVPEQDRENYDQRACAEAFMLEAELYAAMGQQAEKAKKPAQEIRALYGAAYDIALGVLKVRRFVAPKYAPLIEKWRVKARRPMDPAVLWQRYLEAINSKEWVVAARLMTEIASEQITLPPDVLPPDRKREQWTTVGQCYHQAGRDYEAAIAFVAAARWFPEPPGKAYEVAAAGVAAAHAQFKRTQDPADERFLNWCRLQAAQHNIYGGGGIYVQQAELARKDGRYREALEQLAKVKPDMEAYPHALYHKGLTYKAMFDQLRANDKAGPEGKRLARSMEEAFTALYALYKERYPRLKDSADVEGIEKLVSIVGAALVHHSHFYLRDPYKQPDKVLKLTADLPANYDGIEQTPSYPVIAFNRMRAAYTVMDAADLARGAELLAVVEETWEALGNFPEFSYLDKAAGMAATCHNEMAKKLEAAAKAAPDAQKQPLLDRAATHRDQALGFYLQLVKLAPKQTLRTYRYILYGLRTREHEPKSDDYRKIIELAPTVIERFEDSPRAGEELLYVKATLGVAYFGIARFREAVPLLEEVDQELEDRYQKPYQAWLEKRRQWEADPRRNPKPGQPPRRDRSHPEIKEKLADAYLQAEMKEKYKRALDAYIVLTRLYLRDEERYWQVYLNMCETYRRLGGTEGDIERYERCASLVDRAVLRTQGQMGGRKGDFRDLVVKLQRDVAKLPPSPRKTTLDQTIVRVLTQLRK